MIRMSRRMHVLNNQDRLRRYRWRQYELMALVAIWGVGWMLTDLLWVKLLSLTIVLIVVQTGTIEARRMRACGRYHQTNRSVEVIGI
jgi:hypothetical protein